jgi:hypothetical protein
MTVVIDATLKCFICNKAIDFDSGETAVVLRHVAYGYGFAHAGACEAIALTWIFPEPGYDGAAFAHDAERRTIRAIAPAEGWAAVVPNGPQRILAGSPVHFEPLSFWALVEHKDGSRRTEGVVWDAEWLEEPGGAEFPEAAEGKKALLGYAEPRDAMSQARMAEWEKMLQTRYRGEMVKRVLPQRAARLAA